ncbi:nicastrin [Euwallacea fornicatus]|uniref:nicastrin n=1 Tax=Euwallacea fornicatus TaxID=995702 RepID=UPI003390630F
MLCKCFAFTLGLITYLLYTCNADRIKDTMYINIQGSVACYRRMNSTHQIGCSSEWGGSLGIIHYVNQFSDLSFILNNGSAGKYIPILPTSLLTASIMTTLISYKHVVSGVILHPNNEKLKHFSHENKCPNERFSAGSAQCPVKGWNPLGTDLLYQDIPFPMFYLEDENKINIIKDCFQKFNNFSYSTQADRSLCSLELNFFMQGSTNTPTCQRRSNIITNLNPVKLCDPLGDSNVWGSLFPLVEELKNGSKPINYSKYIVIAARLDTTSLFEKTAGAETPVTGLVTLLTVAKLLKQMLPVWNSNLKKNVLFILFNGETYDYIGSQRLLYDMERGQFPIDLPSGNDILPTIYPNNISLFIELSQLAMSNAIYAHHLENSDVVTNFLSLLNKYQPPNSTLHMVSNSLPPSSLHTFIRGNTSIQGLVLADHNNTYNNAFYNSIYDNASNIGYKYVNGSNVKADTIQGYVGQVALMVAKSVFEDVTGNQFNGNVVANLSLVDELFHCYLEDPNCKVHRAVQRGLHLPKTPLSLYVGVAVVDNFLTNLVSYTLAWFSGDMIGPSNPNCTNFNKNHIYRYFNMSLDMDHLDELRCFRATVNMTEAVSPAFIIEDYDWSSNKYSSWSESTWNDMKIRMFLKPSRFQEIITLTIGSITMIFSFVVVYWMKSKCHILFNYPIVEDPPADC